MKDIKISEANIAIIGLGLMGASLAMALKGKSNTLIGIDSDPAVVKLADEKGIFTRVFNNPIEGLREADLVLIAVPVRSILAMLDIIPEILMTSAMIIDIGSTKEKIVKKMNSLPDRFEAIGGHPVCGKEESSLLYASNQIFNRSLFILSPTDRTTQRGRDTAHELVNSIGAVPVWIDACDHDRYLAASSHVPYLVSLALTLATPSEAIRFSGPGLQSTTRLANSSVDVMLDILETNQANIASQIRVVSEWLDRLHDLLGSKNYQELRLVLENGHQEAAKIKSINHGYRD